MTGLELTELIGLAAAATGTGMGVAASEEEKAAMNDKLQAELQRQKGYQQKAGAAFDTSIKQSTPESAQKQWDAQTQKASSEYAKVAGQPSATGTNPTGGGGQGSAIPNAGGVVADNASQMYLASLGKANAAMQGQSGYGLAQQLKDMTANQQIGLDVRLPLVAWGFDGISARRGKR